jgi:hypothetical protein
LATFQNMNRSQDLAAVVPDWMNIAAQTSLARHDLVLENGPDVTNSEDEDSPKEEHGDVETGMYTEGLKAPVLISQHEVARQKAAASCIKSVGENAWIESGSNHPSEDSGFSESSQSAPASPANSRCGSRFETVVPEVTPDPSDSEQSPISNPSVPRSPISTVIVPPDPLSPQKKRNMGETPPIATTPTGEAPPKKGSGKKAATRPADQEATHPMLTRQKASRAGGLRPGVGGSGETDTCVASSYPSKT